MNAHDDTRHPTDGKRDGRRARPGVRAKSRRATGRCFLAVLLTLAALAGGAACEEEAGGNGPATEPDPGSGTGTLGVTATISAEEAVPSAGRPGDLDTSFAVTVTRFEAPVLDATVTFRTDSGEKPLAVGDDGVYRGSHAGYHRIYGLSVAAGPDTLDAVVVGPTLHRLTAPDLPPDGATLPPDAPVEVRWEAEDTAEAVLVRLGGWSATELPDTGAFTIPASAERGDPGAEVRVEVRRETRMGLAGGAAGSEAIVQVRNRTRPARLCPPEGCPDEGE